MNCELEQRRTIAKRLGHQLGKLPSVTAVLVFGSVATGYVDKNSDIDMLIVCEPETPSVTLRRSFLSPLVSHLSIGTNKADALFPSVDEVATSENIAITLHYQRQMWIGEGLADVLERGAITTEMMPFRPYTLAGLLERAWVIVDKEGVVEWWRTRTEIFPPSLKQNLLEVFIPELQEHTDELVSNAGRHIGPVIFIFNLNWAVDKMAGILYALNEVYDPADRRAERTVWPSFRVAPENFSRRLEAILQGPFDDETSVQKAQLFEALVKEVLALAR